MADLPKMKVWWVCTRLLRRGGERIMGPFATEAGALAAREYIEEHEGRLDLWIDVDDPGKCKRCGGDKTAPGLVLNAKLNDDGTVSETYCIDHTKRRETAYAR